MQISQQLKDISIKTRQITPSQTQTMPANQTRRLRSTRERATAIKFPIPNTDQPMGDAEILSSTDEEDSQYLSADENVSSSSDEGETKPPTKRTSNTKATDIDQPQAKRRMRNPAAITKLAFKPNLPAPIALSTDQDVKCSNYHCQATDSPAWYAHPEEKSNILCKDCIEYFQVYSVIRPFSVIQRKLPKICCNCKVTKTYMWYNTPESYPLYPGKLCGLCYRYNSNHPGQLRVPTLKGKKGDPPKKRYCFNCGTGKEKSNWVFIPKGYPRTNDNGDVGYLCENCNKYWKRYKVERPKEWQNITREDDPDKLVRRHRAKGRIGTTKANKDTVIRTRQQLQLNLIHETSSLPALTQEKLADLLYENREEFNLMISEFIKSVIQLDEGEKQKNGKEEEEAIDTELQISHVFKREPGLDSSDEKNIDSVAKHYRKKSQSQPTQQVEDIDSDVSLSYISSDEDDEDEVPDEADEADISDSE